MTVRNEAENRMRDYCGIGDRRYGRSRTRRADRVARFEGLREKRRLKDETAREKRRFDHERDMRDRDALRDRLDAAAEALDTAWRTSAAAYGTLATQGPKGDDLARRVADGFSAIHDANFAIAKLGLWITRDEGVGKAATDSMEALDYIVRKIDLQRALGRYTDDFSFEDLDAHQATAKEASRRYVNGALDEYGLRKT